MSIRWRAVARDLNSQGLLSSIRTPVQGVGSTTSLLPRTVNARPVFKRVPNLQSRVSTPTNLSSSRQFSSTYKRYLKKDAKSSHSILHQQLQSAFPTKTVVALLVLGTAAYFFIDIRYKDWADDAQEAFRGDPAASPLHFYKDREDVNHWTQFHIPDPSAPLKDPEVLRMISERFAEVAFGWEIDEDASKSENIPITHGCRFRSNEPCEDYFALGTAPGPGSKPWNFWSIYDGHAGRHTANYLQWMLHPALSSALSNLSPASPSPLIHSTIKNVFLRVDADIMSRAKHAANWYPAANAAAISALAPAVSGSCALVAAFDPESKKLRVACTGDSRAVLGRWDPLSKAYIAQDLSVDQTGFNEAEVTRISAEHPDEEGMIDPSSGRLFGIAVTRAFGDHRWKWDSDFIKQVSAKFCFGASAPRPGTKTPPYMTAEPEITETDVVSIDPKDPSARRLDGKSDFMILASDGLWDHISSAHAVECVHRWLEARDRGAGKVSSDPQRPQPSFSNTAFGLDAGIDYDAEAGKEVTWKAAPEYFAIEDDNAAVCLARNAMGGSRRGLFLGLLSLPGPMSRYAVDDTTVMVVFFDSVASKEGAGGEPKKKSWWRPW